MHHVHANLPARQPVLCATVNISLVPLPLDSIRSSQSSLPDPDSFSSFLEAPILRALKDRYLEVLLGGMGKSIEDTAWEFSEKIDGHVFKWTLNSLDEDHELEQFFEGLPGLYKSKVIEDPKIVLGPGTILTSLGNFFLNTEDFNLAPESSKQRWVVICLRAARAVRRPHTVA